MKREGIERQCGKDKDREKEKGESERIIVVMVRYWRDLIMKERQRGSDFTLFRPFPSDNWGPVCVGERG
jgi:hypothetical protein